MVLGDESGTISLVFFQSIRYFQRAFEVGEALAVSGRVSTFGRRLQMVHPSIDRLEGGEEDGSAFEGFLHTKGIVPKYGSTEELREVKLDTRGFRRILKPLVEEYSDAIEEWLPPSVIKKEALMPLAEAIRSIHFPPSYEAVDHARRRLKFDELFAMQLALAIRRKNAKEDALGIQFNVESSSARKLVDSLPFHLTRAQIRVVKEIADDMRIPKPMNRLLQGDVGSGKTVVALIAMLIAVDNSYQAAFMAPTEILADQHYHTLRDLLADTQVTIRLLVSGQPKQVRDDVTQAVREGKANIVVGTHALIQEGVEFDKLGLVVIDEQHRFGVSQRLALKAKARGRHASPVRPDMIVMTATPIPRTLALTVYGDLDVSTISELPKQRKPIKTLLMVDAQRPALHEFIRKEVARGRQGYVVYPLVEESEKLDLKAATLGYEQARKEVFPDLRIGLVHGKMRPDEKDAVMMEFKSRRLDVLVATTVIEVGIDIPNATFMVIEHAERFGLSQLHQLRGRVGRGSEQSSCILMAPSWLKRLQKKEPALMPDDEAAEQMKTERRLGAMIDTTDGFKIAEIDLELRGPGDFLGTRQSGLPQLQLANLLTDGRILAEARGDALELVDADPHLRLPEHQMLRKYFDARLRDVLEVVQAG